MEGLVGASASLYLLVLVEMKVTGNTANCLALEELTNDT